MSKEIDAQGGASPIVWVDERISWGAFSYYPRLARVQAYVMTFLGDAVTLTKAAQTACLERTYFSSYFNRKVGLPFTSWVRVVRVAKAIDLLQQCDIPISKVAAYVGLETLIGY